MRLTRKSLIFSLWSMLVLLQAVLFLSEENTLSALLTLAGGTVAYFLVFRRRLFVQYPVSMLVMAGFASYYFFMPPIVTLLEGKALTNNLNVPVFVLFNAVLCLVILVTAHYAYRHSKAGQIRQVISEHLYRPLGFFSTPTNLQLLWMGMIGMLAMLNQVFFVEVGKNPSTLDKFIQAFYPFSYLPYLMLVRFAFDVKAQAKVRLSVRWLTILAVYTVVLLILALGKNQRTIFFLGVASVSLVYLYGALTGLNTGKWIKAKFLVPLMLCFFVLLGPLSDLATSMVIARSQRNDISAMQLVGETWRVFTDKALVRSFSYQEGAFRNDLWDETYVDNLFFARLCNLKYADNGLVLAEGLYGSQQAYLRELELQKALSILPNPVLQVLGFSVDKELVAGASGGDLLLYTATGNQYVLGGFRTGSLFGSGYALFGWWYLPVFFLLFFVTFILADAQVTKVPVEGKAGTAWRSVLSPMLVVTFFPWFFYLTSAATGNDSTAGLLGYIVRGWIQTLVLYTLVFWITRILILIGKSVRAGRRTEQAIASIHK